MGRYTGGFQARGQLCRRPPQGVVLDGRGDTLVIQAKERFRLIPAQKPHQTLHQPFGMAVLERQALQPRWDGGQSTFFPAQPPEDRVNQPGSPFTFPALDCLHRLVYGGAVRHPVHV